MSITVRVSGDFSPEDLNELLVHISNTIKGTERDKFGFASRFWGAVAYSLFESVYFAFITKSLHGQDELGNRWEDLSPRTKAYARKDARKGLTLYDNRAVLTPSLKVRPTLTPYMNKKWGARWAALLMFADLSKEVAGGSTWEYFKRKGAKTLLDLTKSVKIPILHVTGRLQRSLYPNPVKGGQYFPTNKDQIFRVKKGLLEVGTKVPYATYVDEKRPLWPDDISVWIDRATAKGRDAVYDWLPIHLARRRK